MHHAELHSGEANKPRLPLARADLPQEVMALALRLGVKADHPTSRVQLTQIGQMRLAPLLRTAPFRPLRAWPCRMSNLPDGPTSGLSVPSARE
jgi:hypothetical protein